MSQPAFQRIPVGISECLTGAHVRHNGGHKYSSYCMDVLGRYFDYQPCCPEAEIGLGVPRPALRLIATDDGLHLRRSNDPSIDLTEAMLGYSEAAMTRFGHLCGYILMQNSPSCGMERVKRYSEHGNIMAMGPGLFTQVLMQHFPHLPMEESGRLNDPGLRENFVLRVFAYQDWRLAEAQGLSARSLIEFYSRYKYLVMAHHVPSYQRIGRLLADAGKQDIARLADEFLQVFMQALARPAKPRGHVNVLQHLKGYVSQFMESGDREELDGLIERYRTGEIPLIVPMTLLQHHLRRHGDEYVKAQKYLEPYPYELGLRTGV